MKDILNTLNSLLDKADKRMDVQSRMMDLTSEVGELSKEVLKSTQYGKKEFVMTPEFEEEYSDVLYIHPFISFIKQTIQRIQYVFHLYFLLHVLVYF
jgi:dimeric dUTPase (all-alpha-NTP-PPase superfamily)